MYHQLSCMLIQPWCALGAKQPSIQSPILSSNILQKYNALNKDSEKRPLHINRTPFPLYFFIHFFFFLLFFFFFVYHLTTF